MEGEEKKGYGGEKGRKEMEEVGRERSSKTMNTILLSPRIYCFNNSLCSTIRRVSTKNGSPPFNIHFTVPFQPYPPTFYSRHLFLPPALI